MAVLDGRVRAEHVFGRGIKAQARRGIPTVGGPAAATIPAVFVSVVQQKRGRAGSTAAGVAADRAPTGLHPDVLAAIAARVRLIAHVLVLVVGVSLREVMENPKHTPGPSAVEDVWRTETSALAETLGARKQPTCCFTRFGRGDVRVHLGALPGVQDEQRDHEGVGSEG